MLWSHLGLVFAALVLAAWLCSGVLVVHGQTMAIVESFGKPLQAAKPPGLCFVLPWPFMTVVARVDLRQKEIRREIEVKTRDDAFVKLPIAIQMHVLENPVAAVRAHYKFQQPAEQIASYVMNVVRQTASALSLAELYTNRDRIANDVTAALSKRLADVGYHLDTVLVDQPMPSPEIQAAYNRKLAASSLKQAAEQEAEAERIKRVGIARAEAESKELQGQGLAKQRAAIACGLKEAMQTFQEALPGASADSIMALMLSTNAMDMITTASQNRAATILIPYGPNGTMAEIGALTAALRALNGGERGGERGAETGGHAPVLPSAASPSLPRPTPKSDGA